VNRTIDPANDANAEEKTMSKTKLHTRLPTRRKFLGAVAAAGGGAAVAMPYIRNAEAAETTTWKVQTSWPAGVGLSTFKTWAATIKEKTGGELEFKPFAA
jgi:TRAP-type mannitol/chloroaromatic compound transport system substrate-binding protein